MTKVTKAQEQADALLNLYREMGRETGITAKFAQDELGLTHQQFHHANKRVKKMLETAGDGETVAGFTCAMAAGAGAALHGTVNGVTWAYTVVDSAQAEAMRFQHNHSTAHIASRMDTTATQVESLGHGVRGNSKVGKELKRIAARIRMAQEEITELDLPVVSGVPVNALPEKVFGVGARTVGAGSLV